ncbi:MAG: DUF2125 domain-containing protein, partial [Alphaproteobacteria bacterium]|nr:DUF2125 domain-containing protein [Alphaproteobacteria bacterium]
MGRPTRLGLAILAALLVVCGAYTIFWFVVAGQIKSGVAAWAQSAQGNKVEVSWKEMSVTGFPGAFRVRLDRAALRDNRLSPPPQLRIPLLSGTARPWDFADWRIAAADGFSAALGGINERPPVKLTARTADGVVSLVPEGGWKLWLSLYDASLEAAERVHVSSADAWIVVPPGPAGSSSSYGEPTVTLSSNLRQVRLPAAVGPLGDTVEDLDFGITVRGALPTGKLAQAA